MHRSQSIPPGAARIAVCFAPRRRAGLLALVVLTLGGCAADVNPVRDAFVATGLGAEPKPAEDFVTRTRPVQVDYLPVGVSAPKRSIKAKDIKEVKGSEEALDKLRAQNEARAADARTAAAEQAPAPVPRKPPAAGND